MFLPMSMERDGKPVTKETDVAVVLQSATEPKLAKLGINDFLHD